MRVYVCVCVCVLRVEDAVYLTQRKILRFVSVCACENKKSDNYNPFDYVCQDECKAAITDIAAVSGGCLGYKSFGDGVLNDIRLVAEAAGFGESIPPPEVMNMTEVHHDMNFHDVVHVTLPSVLHCPMIPSRTLSLLSILSPALSLTLSSTLRDNAHTHTHTHSLQIGVSSSATPTL